MVLNATNSLDTSYIGFQKDKAKGGQPKLHTFRCNVASKIYKESVGYLGCSNCVVCLKNLPERFHTIVLKRNR